MVLAQLATDPKNRLAAALGNLRAGGGGGGGGFIGLHVMQRKVSPQLQYLRPASTDFPNATVGGRKAALNGSGGPVGAS